LLPFLMCNRRDSFVISITADAKFFTCASTAETRVHNVFSRRIVRILSSAISSAMELAASCLPTLLAKSEATALTLDSCAEGWYVDADLGSSYTGAAFLPPAASLPNCEIFSICFTPCFRNALISSLSFRWSQIMPSKHFLKSDIQDFRKDMLS